MVVLWKNKLWKLEMPYMLFQSLQKTSPQTIVKIEELTPSMYKEEKKVPINELEDWSVVRNLCALGRL
jgi:hypothetical protein